MGELSAQEAAHALVSTMPPAVAEEPAKPDAEAAVPVPAEAAPVPAEAVPVPAAPEPDEGSAADSDAWRRSLQLTSPVMDYAHVFTPERKAALEAKIMASTASNGAQLVVAALPSLQGGALEDFATKLFEQ